MARDSDSIFLSSNIWALTGDRTAPTFPENTGWGITYEQDPALGGALIERENMNQNFYKLSLLSNLVTTYGSGLEWDSAIPYVKGAMVVASNGKPYYSVQANSNQDPTLDTTETYWNDMTSMNATEIVYDNTDGYLTSNLSTSLDAIATFAAQVGQIKILTGNSLQPITNNVVPAAGTPSTEQLFAYASPLAYDASPITHWPLMVSSPTDADIYDFVNDTFVENLALGQVHSWRFIFTFNKPTALTSKFELTIRFYNPLNTFTLSESIYVSEELDSGEFTAEFITISNAASLPSPLGTGQGYKLVSSILGDNGSSCDITLKSATRYSDFTTYQP